MLKLATELARGLVSLIAVGRQHTRPLGLPLSPPNRPHLDAKNPVLNLRESNFKFEVKFGFGGLHRKIQDQPPCEPCDQGLIAAVKCEYDHQQ
jgi:hypothetical protein